LFAHRVSLARQCRTLTPCRGERHPDHARRIPMGLSPSSRRPRWHGTCPARPLSSWGRSTRCPARCWSPWPTRPATASAPPATWPRSRSRSNPPT